MAVHYIFLILYTTIADSQPVQHLKSKMLHLLTIGVPCHLFDVWRCQESYFHQTISKSLYGQCLTSFISVPARGELGLTLLIIAARKFCNGKCCPVKQGSIKLCWFTLKQPVSFRSPTSLESPTSFGFSPAAASSVGILSLCIVQEFCYWADNSWVNWSVPTDLK